MQNASQIPYPSLLKNHPQKILIFDRTLPLWERVYCWVLIVIGVLGGCVATAFALMNIINSEFCPPCYVNIPCNETMSASH